MKTLLILCLLICFSLPPQESETIKRDSLNRVVEIIWYKRGKIVTITKFKYNKKNQIIRREYYNCCGKLYSVVIGETED